MTEYFLQYRDLEHRLWMTRWKHAGEESPEEDAILDDMEVVWKQLSDEEHSVLNAEGPTCWPMDPQSTPPQFTYQRDASLARWKYEGFSSPVETILCEDAL